MAGMKRGKGERLAHPSGVRTQKERGASGVGELFIGLRRYLGNEELGRNLRFRVRAHERVVASICESGLLREYEAGAVTDPTEAPDRNEKCQSSLGI